MGIIDSDSMSIGMSDKYEDKNLLKYLSNSAKEKIDRVYLEVVAKGEKLNAITFGYKVREPAAVIAMYLQNKFGIVAREVIGYGAYIHYTKKGYAVLTGLNINRNRYIMAGELGYEHWNLFPSSFVVHHIDTNRLNDNTRNLFLMFNQGQHAKLHSLLYKNNVRTPDFWDIKEFILEDSSKRLINIEQKIESCSISDFEKEKAMNLGNDILNYLNLIEALTVIREE